MTTLDGEESDVQASYDGSTMAAPTVEFALHDADSDLPRPLVVTLSAVVPSIDGGGSSRVTLQALLNSWLRFAQGTDDLNRVSKDQALSLLSYAFATVQDDWPDAAESGS